MDFPSRPAGRVPRILVLLVTLLAVGAVGFGLMVVLATPHATVRLDADRLVVDARLGLLDQGFEVDRADVVGAEPVRLTGGRRVFGTARPGWCEGTWRYPDLGEVRQATTCGPDAVLVRLRGEATPLVVAPDDPEGLRAALGGTGTGEFPMDTRGETGPAWLVGVLLLPLGAVVLLAARSARPFVYHLESGTLTVPAHLWPVTLRLPGARWTRGPLPRPALRLAGSALPGLYLGLFRARGNLHVAATSLKDGFLLEGERRIYVTPADPEAFEAALRQAGALPAPVSPGTTE